MRRDLPFDDEDGSSLSDDEARTYELMSADHLCHFYSETEVLERLDPTSGTMLGTGILSLCC